MQRWQRSVHDALEFAFTIVGTPIVKGSFIGTLMNDMKDMSPQELHGQAVLIINMVERVVTDEGLAYLKAYYGRELRGGNDEKLVLSVLVEAAKESSETISRNRRGHEKLIRMYFSEDIPMSAIRNEFRCGLPRANELRKSVFDLLDRIATTADGAASQVLHEAGLIIEWVVEDGS